jgi:TonB family protein
LVMIAVAAIVVGLMSHHHSQSAPESPASVAEQPGNSASGEAVSKTADTTRDASQQASGRGIVDRVIPQVPRSARETITGKVRVKVQVSVSPDGKVTSTEFISPGPSRYFARLAFDASQKWTFAPDEGKHGVNRRWMLEYKFGRSSTEVTPIELH